MFASDKLISNMSHSLVVSKVFFLSIELTICRESQEEIKRLKEKIEELEDKVHELETEIKWKRFSSSIKRKHATKHVLGKNSI